MPWKNKYRLIITKYYYIEEVFISLSKLEDWVRCHKEELCEMCKYIRDCIENNIDHWEYRTDEMTNFIQKNKITTREKLASALIGQYTFSNKGWHIGKSILGECWIEDCKYASTKQSEYGCRKCKISDSTLTALEKIVTMERHSVFNKHSIKLSDLNAM